MKRRSFFKALAAVAVAPKLLEKVATKTRPLDFRKAVTFTAKKLRVGMAYHDDVFFQVSQFSEQARAAIAKVERVELEKMSRDIDRHMMGSG